MADSPRAPAPATSEADIRVAPSLIDLAAARVRALGAGVRSGGTAFETALLSQAATAVGDPPTADALVTVVRLVLQASVVAVEGIDDLGRAMSSARNVYGLADASAVPAVGR